MKKLPARVLISKPLNHDFFSITVTDERSGYQVCEVELSLESFAKALANQEVKGEATWRGVDHIGWEAQNKTEDGVTEDNLYKFEVDGWKARMGDLGNHHRRYGGGGHSVVFFRHVHPETGEPAEDANAPTTDFAQLVPLLQNARYIAEEIEDQDADAIPLGLMAIARKWNELPDKVKELVP